MQNCFPRSAGTADRTSLLLGSFFPLALPPGGVPPSCGVFSSWLLPASTGQASLGLWGTRLAKSKAEWDQESYSV